MDGDKKSGFWNKSLVKLCKVCLIKPNESFKGLWVTNTKILGFPHKEDNYEKMELQLGQVPYFIISLHTTIHYSSLTF